MSCSKKPIGILVISILSIMYGVVDVADSLTPEITDSTITVTSPLLGLMLLASGVGILFRNDWARTGMIAASLYGVFRSFQWISYYDNTVVTCLGLVSMVIFGLFIWYLLRTTTDHWFVFAKSSTEDNNVTLNEKYDTSVFRENPDLSDGGPNHKWQELWCDFSESVDQETVRITGAVAEVIMIRRQSGEPQEKVLAFITDSTADCDQARWAAQNMTNEAFSIPTAKTEKGKQQAVENFKAKWMSWADECERERVKWVKENT